MATLPSSASVVRRLPAGGRVTGALTVPASKSVTNRCLNLALLAATAADARGELVLERPLVAEDTSLFLAALERCGFEVERRGDEVRLAPAARPATGELYCGNAGTMLRFLTATLTAVPGRWTVDGSERLRQRPVGPLVDALRPLGAEIAYLGTEGHPPLEIVGGSLGAGRTRLDAGESSQYLSALLMAALAADGEVEVEVGALTSAPYVALTRRAVAAFGGCVEETAAGRWRVRPGLAAPPRLVVEGDYSAACYPAAAAALTGGEVELHGLDPRSAQGDRGFLELLATLGAEVVELADGWRITGRGALRAVTVDLGAMPDQVPTLAALAPFARGTTRITGVGHLRIKESDRLRAMAQELTRLGAEVEERPRGLVIAGSWARDSPPSTPVTIETHDDHRIAMSLALVGLRRPGTSVAEPQVVAKSYPRFWEDLDHLLG